MDEAIAEAQAVSQVDDLPKCMVCGKVVYQHEDAVWQDDGSDGQVIVLHLVCEGMLLEAVFRADVSDWKLQILEAARKLLGEYQAEVSRLRVEEPEAVDGDIAWDDPRIKWEG